MLFATKKSSYSIYLEIAPPLLICFLRVGRISSKKCYVIGRISPVTDLNFILVYWELRAVQTVFLLSNFLIYSLAVKCQRKTIVKCLTQPHGLWALSNYIFAMRPGTLFCDAHRYSDILNQIYCIEHKQKYFKSKQINQLNSAKPA